MKKILIIFIVFLIIGCYPSYEKKIDSNPDYYTEWLEDNGVINVEGIAEPLGTNVMEAIYQMQGIDADCKSRNIRQYTGELESTGELVHVFIPDKVGEPDLLLLDLTYDIDLLINEINSYNLTTDSNTFSIDGEQFLTNDILLEVDNIRMYWITYLWRGLTINDVKIEIDEESIQDFVYTELSSPMIYKIGTYRATQSQVYYIYLGQGSNNEYVIIKENHEHSELDIIHRFPIPQV
jgi:hypothetical protein